MQLMFNIRKQLRGIQLNQPCLKVIVYSDNTLWIVHNKQELHIIFERLQEFGTAPNIQIDTHKTKMIVINKITKHDFSELGEVKDSLDIWWCVDNRCIHRILYR